MRGVIRRKLEAAREAASRPPVASAVLEERKYSPAEAAQLLGISASLMRGRYGRRPGVIRIRGRKRDIIRFPASVVAAILAENTCH